LEEESKGSYHLPNLQNTAKNYSQAGTGAQTVAALIQRLLLDDLRKTRRKKTMKSKTMRRKTIIAAGVGE